MRKAAHQAVAQPIGGNATRLKTKRKIGAGRMNTESIMKKSIFLKPFTKFEAFMIITKALLAGLVGVSLSMANISGVVTDTGKTPIASAVVQLEKGGQKTTTGSDGHFTLATGTSIFPGNTTLLQNGLSTRMSGNLMTVTIAKRAAVEVVTFDLTGKSISTVRKTLDAGVHSIVLPYCGAGIYLYKVKTGNMEFMLKGNSIGGVSSGRAVSSQSPSSNSLAKQTTATVAINDIIVATKDGFLNYRCVQYNSDTTGIQIKMIASAGTVTDTDGNVYQSVKIGNQVWMTENLRVTKYNDGSPIPLSTSRETWKNATTPKYCFYNNATSADSIKNYGLLYNWYVVSSSNPKKVAPAGWHVPTDSEWTIMGNYLVLNGYNWDGTKDTANNKIAQSLAAKTDWEGTNAPPTGTIGCDLTKNNRSGFSALPGGRCHDWGMFAGQWGYSNWWSVTESDASNAYDRGLYYHSDYLSRVDTPKCYGFSVRLVRD